ncbi:MAG TPA: SCP2 sterol-binding domain-containing protein [Solirubrobacterales bacterium]|nr:SCP2 sterol-binding domain-containing protein [Solirubrobacterales bacterium]
MAGGGGRRCRSRVPFRRAGSPARARPGDGPGLSAGNWVRIVAGTLDPVEAMTAGRCSVEGNVRLAARLEGMFGAG